MRRRGFSPPRAEFMSAAEWEGEGIWRGKKFRMG
jgi:hypothetical protein